jgi:hypothetical protein
LRNQQHFATTFATALYSASALDLDIVGCLFDDHEISDSPRKMQYPDVERLVSGHPAQSASEFAFSSVEGDAEMNRPSWMVPRKYCSMRFTRFQ